MHISPFAKRAFITTLSFIIVISASAAVIFWARGFKFDRNQGLIKRTGIIVVTSNPQGGKVYLNDELKGATNTTITFLDPKSYNIKITKEGFWDWQKTIDVKADLAEEIEAMLIPQAPELKPLTSTGAINPTLSPDGTKIAYVVPGTSPTSGIWVLTLNDRPFGIGRDSRQISLSTKSILYEKAKLTWSPDSNNILASIITGNQAAHFILPANSFTNNPQPQTAITINQTLQGWQETIRANQTTILAKVPDNVRLEATQAALKATKTPEATLTPTVNQNPFGVRFSPDEEKILYQVSSPSKTTYRVFDLKKDKVYDLPEISKEAFVSWFPDSDHLMIVEKGQISLIEKDGFNRTTVFGGNFEDNFVFAYPNASRIVINTTFNQTSSQLPNLYSIVLH